MEYHPIENKAVDNDYRLELEIGMTLIEVIIYSALLSILLSGFIRYAWTIHFNDIELSHDIEDAYEK